MALPPELHTAVAARLATAEQRYTRNRRALVDILGEATRPLTIQDVLARGRTLAQSSAYRNLAVLEDTGVVHRVLGTDEWARYELAEDLTDHHHHHLVCTRCGAVEDFTLAGEVETALDSALSSAADDHGFESQRHRLDLVGHCRRCR